MAERSVGRSGGDSRDLIMEAAKVDPAELRSASLLGMAPEAVVKVGEETKDLVKELAHLF